MRVAKPTGKILFRETQRFRQPWLWLVLFGSALATVLPLIVSFKDNDGPGGAAMLGPGLIVICIIVANFTGFYITKLDTVISSDGLYFKENTQSPLPNTQSAVFYPYR
jgi:hypothetical protein